MNGHLTPGTILLATRESSTEETRSGAMRIAAPDVEVALVDATAGRWMHRPEPSHAQILERIVTQDLSRGKESISIQCVNGMDDSAAPDGYIYVAKNCVTDSVPVDRNISKLQVR